MNRTILLINAMIYGAMAVAGLFVAGLFYGDKVAAIGAVTVAALAYFSQNLINMGELNEKYEVQRWGGVFMVAACAAYFYFIFHLIFYVR